MACGEIDALVGWRQNGSTWIDGSIMDLIMAVNLSVKNVPDRLAEQLRRRASINRRSLQKELLSILEAAVGGEAPRAQGGVSPAFEPLTIDELAAISRQLFPAGTESSVAYLRGLREGR
jgi:plasmid stability protein